MKLMFHYINKEKNSSPTIVANRIKFLLKNDNFIFCDLNQKNSAKGVINFKLINDLSMQIKKENPDVVILSGIASAFHAVLACKKCRVKKIILITHGIDSMDLDRSWFKRKIFKYLIEPMTVALSNVIQCNSKFVYNLWYMKLFAKNKRFIIPNPLPQLSSFFKENKIKKNKDFTIVSTSRIIKNKGYDYIIDAIKFVNFNNYKMHFVIVGTGSYFAHVKRELACFDNVELIGQISNEEYLKILAKAHLFVLPSKLYETYGLVNVEAGILGITSICGTHGAVKEIINNSNGFVLNKYSSEELIKTLIYAYEHQYEVDKKGKKLRNDILNFNSDNIIREKLLNLYKL